MVVLIVAARRTSCDRITALLDPWSDPLGVGFHTIQGLLALGLGGIFGAGLGESRWPAACSCPTPSTTSSSPIIGEEFGLVGGVLVDPASS